MGKKGISLEEKKKLIRDFLINKGEVFTLKELEKSLVKETGLNSMSVKDIVLNLVDENLISCRKIGSSNYFWEFPYDEFKKLYNEKDELIQKLQESCDRLKEVETELEALKNLNDDEDTVSKLQEQLSSLEKQLPVLKSENELLSASDPEILYNLKYNRDNSIKMANMWTDNYYITKSWLKNKFCVSDSDIDKHFNLPADMDYIG